PYRYFFSSANRKFITSPDNSASSNYCIISTFNQHHKQYTMAHTTYLQVGDGNTNSGNIIGSFNNIVNKSDEDAQIVRWLSPLKPSDRHQTVRDKRFDGVGDWLLEPSEFREWRLREGEADEAILLCSGKPGAGKTYLR